MQSRRLHRLSRFRRNKRQLRQRLRQRTFFADRAMSEQMDKPRVLVLTGAGISAESGIRTFRAADGLWEEHKVEDVATPEGFARDPALVQAFYNARRRQLQSPEIAPNAAHLALAKLEQELGDRFLLVTQNVDNLHEKAGSTHVIHLHGELTKVCSSRDPYDPAYIRQLTPNHSDVAPGTRAGDGSLLRPYIVFFGEAVPNIEKAAEEAMGADIFVIIGTSLNVHPAAGLLHYVRPGTPVYYIDPNPASVPEWVTVIPLPATKGVEQLARILHAG